MHLRLHLSLASRVNGFVLMLQECDDLRAKLMADADQKASEVRRHVHSQLAADGAWQSDMLAWPCQQQSSNG